MLSLRIKGTTREIGKSQGYLGLCVRDTHLPVQGKGVQPVMQTLWEPTPAELAALNNGAHIMLTILGTQHPPIMLTVEGEEDGGVAANLSR